MRRLLWALGVLVLTAVVVIGLRQAGDSGSRADEPAVPHFDLSASLRALRGAPKPLASLYAQPNGLLSGGTKAFDARIDSLRGHPVIVNKWASWCGPCRFELPFLQQEVTERGKQIAFLGVDGNDKRPAARRFLETYPLPYPSYEDPAEKIARHIRAPANYPITVFFDARGRTAFIHQGAYPTRRALAADIDRYLG